jgi:hypothetical protein
MSGPVVLVLRLLLAVSLYAFLGFALVSLWYDIRQQGALLASRKATPISLTITCGEFSPEVRHFVQSEITIGRDPACECPVKDEAISAHHTLLNQFRLSIPTVVISEDLFKCGETSFLISLTGDILQPVTKQT